MYTMTLIKDIYVVRVVGPSGAEKYLGTRSEVNDIEDAKAFNSPDAARYAIDETKFVLNTFGRFIPIMDVQKVDDPEWTYG